MPTPTYTALANITLGSSASSVTFSSIPATYRDLVVVWNGAGSTLQDLLIALNGNTTGSNYPGVRAFGDGAGAQSNTQTNREVGLFSTDTNTAIIQIMDYSATDKHKTMLSRSSRGGNFTGMYAVRWANTSAVTSVAISTAGGTLSAGGVFSLYGIAA